MGASLGRTGSERKARASSGASPLQPTGWTKQPPRTERGLLHLLPLARPLDHSIILEISRSDARASHIGSGH